MIRFSLTLVDRNLGGKGVLSISVLAKDSSEVLTASTDLSPRHEVFMDMYQAIFSIVFIDNLCSDVPSETESFVFKLYEGEQLLDTAEASIEDLGSSSDIIFLTFTDGEKEDVKISVGVGIESVRELGIDELEQFESNSTMAAVSTTDIEDQRSHSHSPSIGSIVGDQISDGCSFIDITDSASGGSFSDPISISGSGLTSKSSSSRLPLGLIELEVVGVENVPPSKLRLNYGGPQSPFVVLSFGRKSFRTKTAHRNSNPVWKERVFIPVLEHESGYHATFSLYNHRALAGNICTGKAKLKVSELLQRPNHKFKLALEFEMSEEEGNLEHPCKLLLKCAFFPMEHVRREFWLTMISQFAQDQAQKLNLVEFESMMNCIGPDLSDEILDHIAERLGPYDEGGEFTFDTVIDALGPLQISSRSDNDGATIVILQCPVCYKTLQENVSSDDIAMHIFLCCARANSGKVDKEMMGGFLTEEHASRKWLTRIFSAFSFGGYQLGKNNGNIFVHDRRTGKLIEEKMPVYIRLGIRMIYSKSGRAADLQMVRRLLHSMTLKQGAKFSSSTSVHDIQPFIKFHGLNLDEVLDPLDSFRSFNEFFYRKLKPGSRPLASDDPNVAFCPADSRLICYQTIDDATNFWIKGANFTVSKLMKDDLLGEYFSGGSIAVCRLAPQDYHRFHCPIDATVNMIYHIPGAYFTVNPMAIRKPLDVLTENARTAVLLNSPIFGKVAYVAVGAMMVGSILMSCDQGDELKAGDEIGYFAFGGSTIVLVFPPRALQFDDDLLENSQECLETLVRVGQTLGHIPNTTS